MKISKILFASTIVFALGSTSAIAQSTTTPSAAQTNVTLDTSYYNKSSVWIKDSGQAKEYLKSIGAEDKLNKPQAAPTIYQQGGSVWCKNGTVIDREKGVSCVDEPKK